MMWVYYGSSMPGLELVSSAGYARFSGSALIWFVYQLDELVVFLVASSLRFAFIWMLTLYLRGIGNARTVLATGAVGEVLASSPYIYPIYGMILMYGPYWGSLVLPVPILFVLGLLLVRFRDSLTTREMTSDVVVRPQTVEEQPPAVPGA
jgi:hypothetical protein